MPDIGEWWDPISAVATFAATMVALGVAVGEVRRRRRDQEDADAAQARLVVLRRDSTGFLVVNHSAQPLLGVEIVRAVYAEPDGGRRWTPYLNGKVDVLPTADVVAPGKGFGVTAGPFQVEGTSEVFPGKGHDKDDALQCTFRFIDAQGLRWERTNLEPPQRILDQRRRWWRRS